MRSDQVAVRRSELTAHVGRVESIGADVTTAARAAGAVRAGGDAYGTLCVLVPIALNAVQDILVDGISAAADSLRDTGRRLRTTAQDYDAADRRRRAAFPR
jgi:hypothetical protein